MTTIPKSVQEDNLSVAWAKSFLAAMSRGTSALAPLTVTVTGLQGRPPAESVEIRKLLDETLIAVGRRRCRTVANTIFPANLWRRSSDRHVLYDKYREVFKKIRQRPINWNGIYLQRMIDYGRGPEDGNQLEHLIKTYLSGNHRPSALQMTIFDVERDHSNSRRRGFPCLQHVSFSPLGRGKLSVNAFYASQYLCARAYGNYLGLCRLGLFVAQELKLELAQMTCFTGRAMIDAEIKGRLRGFADRLGEMVRDGDTARAALQPGGPHADAR
jgi:hypothetical protein